MRAIETITDRVSVLMRDDIGLTLQQGEAIAAYESDDERTGPVTTAL